MAATLSGTRKQKLQKLKVYLPQWAANAVAIGLTGPQVAGLQSAVDVADDAELAQQAAINAAQMATMDWYHKIDTAAAMAQGYIKAIKAKADIDNNPNIYVLAGLPEPDNYPTPVQAPGMPTNFAAAITNTGYVQLTWDGTRSSKIFTSLWRRLPDEAGYTLVGSVNGMNFTDVTVPPGTQSATYFAVANRQGQSSDPTEIVTVNFGQLQIAA